MSYLVTGHPKNGKRSKAVIILKCGLESLFSLFAGAMMLMTLSTTIADDVVAPLPNIELFEKDIVRGNTLDDKSTAYYFMTISD